MADRGESAVVEGAVVEGAARRKRDPLSTGRGGRG
jgi:hypothetical protein